MGATFRLRRSMNTTGCQGCASIGHDPIHGVIKCIFGVAILGGRGVKPNTRGSREVR
jgi:hypothetical protein